MRTTWIAAYIPTRRLRSLSRPEIASCLRRPGHSTSPWLPWRLILLHLQVRKWHKWPIVRFEKAMDIDNRHSGLCSNMQSVSYLLLIVYTTYLNQKTNFEDILVCLLSLLKTPFSHFILIALLLRPLGFNSQALQAAELAGSPQGKSVLVIYWFHYLIVDSISHIFIYLLIYLPKQNIMSPKKYIFSIFQFQIQT